MAQNANIVLTHNLVDETFTPRTNNGVNRAEWRSNASVPVNERPFIVAKLRDGSQDVKRRTVVNVTVPVVDATTGVVDYVSIEITVLCPFDASQAILDKTVSYASGALTNAVLSDIRDNGAMPS